MSNASFPPPGFMAMRRVQRSARARSSAISEHRISLQLSPTVHTVCRESGRTFVRLRGDIDFTPAAARLGFDVQEESESLELCIAPRLLERMLEGYGPALSSAMLRHRHLVREMSLSHLAFAIESEQHPSTDEGRRYLDALGVALVVRLLGDGSVAEREPGAGSEPTTSVPVQRVLEFIDANLHGSLSLQRLAKVAGLSSSHLRREFAASQRTTLHRYITTRRVERARALLVERAMPASEVALSAGFSHQSHMARWMRRLLGVTPRELVDRVGQGS